jgi:hypothetical protein
MGANIPFVCIGNGVMSVKVSDRKLSCCTSPNSNGVKARSRVHAQTTTELKKMGDLDTAFVQEELTSLLDSALRMGELNGGAEWSNALLFSSSRSSDTSTVENITSEDATKWRFDTAKRLGTVSIVRFILLIFCRHDEMMWVLYTNFDSRREKQVSQPCVSCVL